jgi:predicted ester cyclase
MSATENEAVLRRAQQYWNESNLDGYLNELYHPDVVLHGFVGVEPGLASVTQFYRTFFAAFPGIQLVFHDVFSHDNKVACRFSLTGTNTGSFMGVPPTGKEVHMDGMTIIAFRDGKCVERWSQADFLGLLQQLGALPKPT